MVRTLVPICALLLLAADAAGRGRDIVLERGQGDDTATVGKALAEVADGDTIRLGGGEWEFRPESAARIHLGVSNNSSGEKKVIFNLQGKRDVTIDGGGARLVFVRDAFPFALRGMTNVVLRNFTIDTPIAPVTAFSVVEKGESGFRVRFEKSAPPFRIEDGRFAVETPYGWSRLDLLSVHAVERMYVDYFYLPHCTRDKNTLPTRFVAVDPEPLNGREVFFRYRCDDHPKSVRCMFPVGEKLCINLASDRTCVACLFEGCRDVRVENVTIRQFGGMGVVAQRCENVALDHYRVLPSEGHVISTSADAVMLTNCGGDCRLTHCEISHSMDDALNVHGNYLEVVSAQGDRVELRMRHHEQKGFLPYRTGDRVEFVEPRRRDVVAAGRVLSARLTADDRVELVTDAPLGRVVPGTVVENVTLCPDVTLTDNRFSDYPHIRLAGRGKMTIERNRMERSFIALYFYDLLEYWFEAGRLRDVTVRNNVFDDCNRMGGDAFIKIGLTGWKATDADVPRIHEGITIRDNAFRNVRTRRLEAYGVRNLATDITD